MTVALPAEQQQPIDDDAARQALEEILRCRRLILSLMHMPEFQKLPLEKQIPVEALAGLFEHSLEILALHHKQIIERKRKVATKLRSRS
jgi:hypothetical protein